jgi:DNA-binding HxlR family transcriptional regulator
VCDVGGDPFDLGNGAEIGPQEPQPANRTRPARLLRQRPALGLVTADDDHRVTTPEPGQRGGPTHTVRYPTDDNRLRLLAAHRLLGRGPHRFNELHRSVEGISQRMLTRMLRALERDGLAARTVHPTVPPSVEYDLTPLGHSLLAPLSALADWAVDHGAEIATARNRHDAHPPLPSERSTRR